MQKDYDVISVHGRFVITWVSSMFSAQPTNDSVGTIDVMNDDMFVALFEYNNQNTLRVFVVVSIRNLML